MTTDQILNYDGNLPKEVSVKDKPEFEQMNMINQLDQDDKNTVLNIIETMLTKKKFKDFFDNNVANL